MARAIVLLMDSLGIGASLDAGKYGDEGTNTFVHIVQACEAGLIDKAGIQRGPLFLPNLMRLGLYHAAVASAGLKFVDLGALNTPTGLFGYAVEQSLGKDTPSGHWELMGVPVNFDWGYFPDTEPCFPNDLISELVTQACLPGVLGNKRSSGTQIIQELGDEHIRTGKPIVYTSADSVFQIAAHEEHFGLEKLYEVCRIARKLVDELKVGRVIARPFRGESAQYLRTGNRVDYTIPPPQATLLDFLKEAGRDVVAIGKVDDIFAHAGITRVLKADDNMSLFDTTIQALNSTADGGLIFTNFVDFDSSYGHRRDVLGYANALEQFDARLPELEKALRPEDIVVITADHGCDPTFPGSDHTREHVPVLVFGPNVLSRFIGRRETFADVGQSLAEYLGMSALMHGVSFL